MDKTEHSTWVDIRRYEWDGQFRKSPIYDMEEASKIFASLGGLEVHRIPIAHDVNLGFYVFQDCIGVEFSIQEYPRGHYARSMVIGKDKEKVTLIQDKLEGIICEEHDYHKYAEYAADPKSDSFKWLERIGYGHLYRLAVSRLS